MTTIEYWLLIENNCDIVISYGHIASIILNTLANGQQNSKTIKGGFYTVTHADSAFYISILSCLCAYYYSKKQPIDMSE